MVKTRSQTRKENEKQKANEKIQQNEELYNHLVSKQHPNIIFTVVDNNKEDKHSYINGQKFTEFPNNSFENVRKNVIHKLNQVYKIIMDRDLKIKKIIEIFKLLDKRNNPYGYKLLNNPKICKVIKKKLIEFYYKNNVTQFYKIYRDLFGERIPFI